MLLLHDAHAGTEGGSIRSNLRAKRRTTPPAPEVMA